MIEKKTGFLQKHAKKVFTLFKHPFNREPTSNVVDEEEESQQIQILREANEDDAEKFADYIISIVKNHVLSRRSFLGLLGFTFASSGTLVADQLFLDGRLRMYLMKAFQDEQFRRKFLESIGSGELINEDIPNLIAEIIGKYNYSIELGERVELSESWMREIFSEYEVRLLVEDGVETEKFLFIARVDETELLVGASPTDMGGVPTQDIVSFEETVQAHSYDFYILPRAQKEEAIWMAGSFDRTNQTPSLYAGYQVDGEVVEYFEEDGEFRPRGGALVLIDGKIKAVPHSLVEQYRVGENCQALEVFAFSVSASTYEEDMLILEGAETTSGLSPNSATYASFVATFEKDGEFHTYTVSIYNHVDQSGNISGEQRKKNELLTVRHGAEICQQILREKKYSNFTMLVPDAGEFSAPVISQPIDNVNNEDLFDGEDFFYQEGLELYRALWAYPYLQPRLHRYFLAATRQG